MGLSLSSFLVNITKEFLKEKNKAAKSI